MSFVRELDETYTVIEKETIVLECEVNKEQVNCVWKRYGKVIEEDDRIKIESFGKIHRLTINDVNLQDKQTISCSAIKGRKIDDEIASTSAKIIIKGLKFNHIIMINLLLIK